jgi:hypothetical protein
MVCELVEVGLERDLCKDLHGCELVRAGTVEGRSREERLEGCDRAKERRREG